MNLMEIHWAYLMHTDHVLGRVFAQVGIEIGQTLHGTYMPMTTSVTFL